VGTPAAPPPPTPTPAPPTTPPTPVTPARPGVTVGGSGTRGRFAIRVQCFTDCRLTGKLVASRATARRLGLRRTLGTVERRITVTDRRAYTIKLPAATLRAMKRHGLARITFKATFTARYDDGRRTTAARTVRVKRAR
jgi:hypothetical protein